MPATPRILPHSDADYVPNTTQTELLCFWPGRIERHPIIAWHIGPQPTIHADDVYAQVTPILADEDALETCAAWCYVETTSTGTVYRFVGDRLFADEGAARAYGRHEAEQYCQAETRGTP
jgi:hypothetical protein